MKKLITTILLSVLTLVSYSQTKLDKEIFKVINEYRISNGLTPWEWDQKTFKVAEKHNYYQTQISDIYHGEPKNIRNHEEINSLGGRFDDGKITDWSKCGENLAVVNSDNLTIVEIAEKTLSMWINSSTHNDLLLSANKKYTYGAISSKYSKEYVNATFCRNWTYVTLNVYQKEK